MGRFVGIAGIGTRPFHVADSVKRCMIESLSVSRAGRSAIRTDQVRGCWYAIDGDPGTSEYAQVRLKADVLLVDGDLGFAGNCIASIDHASATVPPGSEDIGPALQAACGHFGVAIYNDAQRRLFLARDHFGLTPVYWWADSEVVVFGTALGAVLQWPGIRRTDVDTIAVQEFLTMGYVPGARTPIRQVAKVRQGSTVSVDLSQAGETVATQYWRLPKEDIRRISATAAERELDRLLRNAVERIDDASDDIGAQLSGGVDSSLLVALLQRRRDRRKPLRTYTVGFDVSDVDESHHARTVADLYGTTHHETRLTAELFFNAYRDLLPVYGEPVGDPSAVATYVMGRVASQNVRFMVGGEGADEMYAGYQKYWIERYMRWLQVLPNAFRESALRGIATSSVVPERWNRVLRTLAVTPESRRFAVWYGAFGMDEMYQMLVADGMEAGEDSAPVLFTECKCHGGLNRQLCFDTRARLADYVLANCERTSTANGMTPRLPFLDPTLVEFAFALPTRMKLRQGQTKWLLKKVAARYLPKRLVYRRKVGFRIPLAEWFRDVMRPTLAATLLDDRTLSRGLWNADRLRQYVRDHGSGERDRSAQLWAIFALETWLRFNVDADRSHTERDPEVRRWKSANVASIQ